jgi:signal transduction histidine kinase
MRAQRNSLRERIDFLEQRRALEEEIVRAGEREQMRIGRDLHDGLCQNLAAIDCAVACLKHDMQEQLPSQVDSTDFIHEQLRRAISEARSIAQGIFPVQTSEDGFLTAVGELVDSTSRAHRVKIILDAPAELSVHDRSVGMHLYRIIQEALNNALKHSGAAEIRVRLRAESGNLSAEVVDSGCGFQPRRSDGMGFRTMRYRAESIGGTLTIISPEEGGTAVLCSRVKNVTPTVERTKTDVAASGSREMGEAAAAPHSAPAAASEPAGVCESLV